MFLEQLVDSYLKGKVSLHFVFCYFKRIKETPASKEPNLVGDESRLT